ncbi:MAG: PH domain-containing protein [Pirellulaceae bacterium]
MPEPQSQKPSNPLGGPVRKDEPEQQLWQGTYSVKDMYGTFLMLAILSIVAIVVAVIFATVLMPVLLFVIAGIAVVWLFFFVRLGWKRLSVKYELTTQRFIHEEGVLRRITDRMEVIDIQDVTFEQGILDRMFGVGTLCITSTDRSHAILRLNGIENVREVAHMMDKARRNERLRRGLHIDTG